MTSYAFKAPPTSERLSVRIQVPKRVYEAISAHEGVETLPFLWSESSHVLFAVGIVDVEICVGHVEVS